MADDKLMQEMENKNKIRKKSMRGEIWHRFKRNKAAVVGLILFAFVLLIALCADLIVSYDSCVTPAILQRLQAPSAQHWFGTDNFGRDILSRVIHGARYSLLLGVGCVAIGITVGGFLGAISGFYGGKVDAVIVRISDTIMCIPLMLLVLCIVTALGSNLVNLVIAMVIANTPNNIRIVRSAILPVIGQDYIEAARSCGAPNLKIIFRHILPNAIGPVIVQATMQVGLMIISAAGISYLGVGIQPPTPEWGAMLNEAKTYMMAYPYMVITPGIAIGITALSLNLMGDGLRDALDPKLKD